MKHKLITTLIAAAAMITAAPSADAQRHHYRYHPHAQHERFVFISGYHRCGTPIYSERYIVKYDRRHRPVYGYRTVRHQSHFVRPAPRGYYVAPAPCPPPRRSGGYIRIRF